MSDLSLSFTPSSTEIMAAGSAEIERLRDENRAFRTAAHQLTLANELLRDALATARHGIAFWGGLLPDRVQAEHDLQTDLDAVLKTLTATAACRLCGAETQAECKGLEQ